MGDWSCPSLSLAPSHSQHAHPEHSLSRPVFSLNCPINTANDTLNHTHDTFITSLNHASASPDWRVGVRQLHWPFV